MDHVCTTMKSTNVYRLQERKYKARTAVRQHLSQQRTIRQQRQRKALERTKREKVHRRRQWNSNKPTMAKEKEQSWNAVDRPLKQRNRRRKRKNKKTGRQRQTLTKEPSKRRKRERNDEAPQRYGCQRQIFPMNVHELNPAMPWRGYETQKTIKRKNVRSVQLFTINSMTNGEECYNTTAATVIVHDRDSTWSYEQPK